MTCCRIGATAFIIKCVAVYNSFRRQSFILQLRAEVLSVCISQSFICMRGEENLSLGCLSCLARAILNRETTQAHKSDNLMFWSIESTDALHFDIVYPHYTHTHTPQM